MTPKIDKRRYSDHLAILEEARIRLANATEKGLRAHLLPEWTAEEEAGEPLDFGLVMNRLYARLMTILGERINRIPDKHFAAFLDMVGVERLPGSPARAPITFTPAPGTKAGQPVPQGTQVATTQTTTEKAVTFETEAGFELTPVELKHIVTIDPRQDSWREITESLQNILTDDQYPRPIIFQGTTDDKPVEHSIYMVHDGYCSQTSLQDLIIEFHIAEAGSFAGTVKWEAYDGKQWVVTDDVDHAADWLTESNLVNTSVTIHDFKGSKPVSIDGDLRSWIRVRLAVPLTDGDYLLPEISNIRIAGVRAASAAGINTLPEDAFTNTLPISLDLDFYPLGEYPKRNDAFYIASELFNKPQIGKDRTVQLDLKLLEVPAGDTQLAWEYWSAENRWKPLSLIETGNQIHLRPSNTDLFTLTFNIPNDLVATTVNSVKGYWIRTRVVSGSYSAVTPVSVTVAASDGTTYSYTYNQTTSTPPAISIADLSIDFTVPAADRADLHACKTINHFEIRDHTDSLSIASQRFIPFKTLAKLNETSPALYLGFNNTFNSVRVSQLFILDQPDPDLLGQEASTDSPVMTWEYRNASGQWIRLDTEDDTRALSSSSTVAFNAPLDMSSSVEFGLGKNLYWMRARVVAGTLRATRRLKEFHLNSVWAKSIRTIENEMLGAGTGEKMQTFRLSQAPVLPGEILRIREANLPSAEVIEELEQWEKDLAAKLEISTQPVVLPQEEDPKTGERYYWIRWYPVPNSRFSTPNDRHYVLDRVNGEINFSGMPVPRGRQNVRVDRYQVSYGAHAKRAAKIDTVQQLTSSLPYVAAVTNRIAAQGGAGPEDTMAKIFNRGPGTLKHRGRAVTREDFEALAREADPGLRLVRALPVTNATGQRQLGAVTLIVVPFSLERQPQPTPGLLDQIHRYLEKRGSETATHKFFVIGPTYIEVSITTQIIPIDPTMASTLAARVANSLEAYFHPLTGGANGEGWPFAANLHISNVYTYLEAIDGVDAVPKVEFNNVDDPELVSVDSTHLVSSGIHVVEIVA
ncbi:MAG: baseplate J/gp47 family protein [Deltaproteobacteria bacterium]|jgi:hypothetical protein|nr:baseplate J/gp47 family protein [Deltaproteobacteria bacterium]